VVTFSTIIVLTFSAITVLTFSAIEDKSRNPRSNGAVNRSVAA